MNVLLDPRPRNGLHQLKAFAEMATRPRGMPFAVFNAGKRAVPMCFRTVRSSSSLRLLSLVAACVLTLNVGASERPQPTDQRGEEAQARLTEVRLRKLHLVRPDLIPYPIQLEIYC